MSQKTHNEPDHRSDRDGFALVTTVLIVLVLSVLAVAVAFIASAEKKTSFAEGVHVSSIFSADAGAESAINFLRTSDSPPQIMDFAAKTVRDQGITNLQGSQQFEYDTVFLDPPGPRHKPGWSLEYFDFDYQITSRGEASVKGETNIAVVASRLYKLGY
jgi:hypothetical protein